MAKIKQPRATKTENGACIVNGRLMVNGSMVGEIDGSERITAVIESLKAIRLISLDLPYERIDYINGLFIKSPLNVEMTLRSEKRWQQIHWYAYRRVGGKLFKRYVGGSDTFSIDKLIELAEKMPSL